MTKYETLLTMTGRVTEGWHGTAYSVNVAFNPCFIHYANLTPPLPLVGLT